MAKDAVRPQDPLLTNPAARLKLLQASVQAGLTDTVKAKKGTFGSATTGIFGGGQPRPGIPAFGGLFGMTGRQARKRVEGGIDNFNAILEQSGITPTAEMSAGIRQAFEAGFGEVGAQAVVNAAIANSPEAIVAREQEAAVAQKNQADKERAALDKHEFDKQILAQERMFLGVPRETVDKDRDDYASLQQGLNLVAEWETLFNAYGTEVAPGFLLSDEDASAKQAYRNIEQRFIPMFQKLFNTGVITPTELEFLQEQFPTASEWNTMTDPERRVAIGGVKHFLENEIDVTLFSNIALSTPGAPLFLERVPGVGRSLDQILAIGDPPGTELTLEQLAAARAEAGALQDRATAATESIPSITDITGGPSLFFPGGTGTTGEEEVEAVKKAGKGVLDFLIPGQVR